LVVSSEPPELIATAMPATNRTATAAAAASLIRPLTGKPRLVCRPARRGLESIARVGLVAGVRPAALFATGRVGAPAPFTVRSASPSAVASSKRSRGSSATTPQA
jgi:hypothetical protein